MRGLLGFIAMMVGASADPVVLLPAILAGCYLKKWAHVLGAGAGIGFVAAFIVSQMMPSYMRSIPAEVVLAKVAGAVVITAISFLIARAVRRSRAARQASEGEGQG